MSGMLWEEDVPGLQAGPSHFDVCGPLPDHGVTILEASAGTGKTYTIAALVARLVAEGVAPLSENPRRHLHADGHGRTPRPGA